MATIEERKKALLELVPAKFRDLTFILYILRLILVAGLALSVISGFTVGTTAAFNQMLLEIVIIIFMWILTRFGDVLISMERNQRSTNELLYRLGTARRKE